MIATAITVTTCYIKLHVLCLTALIWITRSNLLGFILFHLRHQNCLFYLSKLLCTSHKPISVADFIRRVNHVKRLISLCLQHPYFVNSNLCGLQTPPALWAPIVVSLIQLFKIFHIYVTQRLIMTNLEPVQPSWYSHTVFPKMCYSVAVDIS